MYNSFYGLSDRPFQLTPDPRFYFDSATHRKAMAYLGYGLAQGEGFIVITGEIGAGKTTLTGQLMASVDAGRLTATRVTSTQVESDDMLRLIAQGFGIVTDSADKALILQRIESFLIDQSRMGRRSLLVVDEAQNLPVSALEELRLLSNLQARDHALLQIFLLGQPEFRERLQGLEQLRQRVIATHHLEPMHAEEVEPYIVHRLTLVGWAGNPRFTPEAFPAIYDFSGGIPRQINALLSRILLLGAIGKLSVIDTAVVSRAIADLTQDVPEPVAGPQAGAGEAVVGPVAAARIAALEARIAAQEQALKRVLALLVDWVEAAERRGEGA
ncbi:XrtA/PEP-CTERM system-associated ATPase [Sphingomonas flavalba]|uniref:XrtA/PEP-CTERM system-associated ATPase n=1 Tax=Sphingomonas flavalba TaxID=2559804 RepID=UPI0039E18901